MKVYIASKYIQNQTINQKIYNTLVNAGLEVFLPETINLDAVSKEEQLSVAKRCYKELMESDAVIWVSPYGESVTSEIGFAISQKYVGNHIRIILFGKQPKLEAMTSPYIDAIVDKEEIRDESSFITLLDAVRGVQL